MGSVKGVEGNCFLEEMRWGLGSKGYRMREKKGKREGRGGGEVDV